MSKPGQEPQDIEMQTNGTDYHNCEDNWGDCQDLANDNQCWQIKGCRRSCGLCGDLPRHPSVDCYDEYSNCPELVQTNKCGRVLQDGNGVALKCQKSCGKCAGDTPHDSNTCYDEWDKCQKSCGKCAGDTP